MLCVQPLRPLLESKTNQNKTHPTTGVVTTKLWPPWDRRVNQFYFIIISAIITFGHLLVAVDIVYRRSAKGSTQSATLHHWLYMDFNRCLEALLLLLAKIWAFVFVHLKKQTRNVAKHQSITYDIPTVSPLSRHRLCLVSRKTLVLDLDETLIHSHHDGNIRTTTDRPNTPPDFKLSVNIDGHPVKFCVHKRPHVDYFLDVIGHWYDLVVFTASMEIYGSSVADKLDNNRGILTRRYFRQHCELVAGSYTKNLSFVQPNMSQVFILDNSPAAYRAYPNNAIPIKSWFSDAHDTALLNLLPFLDALRFCHDARSILNRNLHLQIA